MHFMMIQMRLKRETVYDLLFLLIVIVAIAIRLKYIFVERMWPDEALYAWYAQRLFTDPTLIFSKEIIEFHPPLFAVLLAIGRLFFSSDLASRVIPFVFNILGIIAIYLVGMQMSGRFLGLVGAVSLSFNYLYIDSGTHILIDTPITTAYLLLALLLLRIDCVSTCLGNICVGLMAASIILLKWSGMPVILLLFSYYFFISKQSTVLGRLKEKIPVLMIPMVTTLLLSLNNRIQMGKLFPDISALQGQYLIKPFWYYMVNLHNILIAPFLLPFFLYGLFIIALKRDSKSMLMGLWFIIIFLSISFIPEKTLRYSVPVIPGCLLISGLGVEILIEKIFKIPKKVLIAKIICLVLVALSCWQLYPRTKALLGQSISEYTGFREAGQVIGQYFNSSARIFAGSPRAIRYYTGINFVEYGGNLEKLPKSQLEFEKILRDSQAPIILEVDYWERTQPAWIFPLSQEKIKYLEQRGFRLVKVVTKSVMTAQDVDEPLPVAWIFIRDGKG